ncbi:MAG: SurA N-terminal domain-containing protein [Phycisphaerales bacterium]|nr:SurA N-terminal domain-containing protein [Phycisphaerales bacterium]
MTREPLILAALIAGSLALVSGCGGHDHVPSAHQLSLAEFSDAAQQWQAPPDDAAINEALIASGFGPRPTPPEPFDRSGADDAFFTVDAQMGQRVVVDSLIGQVNGRPIYADEVLSPIMDRLQAEYLELPYASFRQRLITLVMDQLNAVVLNELIVAEARAGLSSDEQTGLLGVMNMIREQAVGKRGGVLREAERQLLEEEGKTIDEYLESEQQKLLISELLQRRVSPRSIVTWRDIERSYRKRIREFQPEATVALGRIRVRTDGNQESIALWQKELNQGEPFDVVADQAGMPDAGLWETFRLPKGGLADIEIAEFYKQHLEGLEPGETSQSFQRGSWTYWVSVLEISRPDVQTLDDAEVQQQLQRDLAAQHHGEAEGEFIQQVLQRGIFDDIQIMSQRAVLIAASRFPPR